MYHVLIEKSITWSDFNLEDADWELLQIGLVLFFLQVGRNENTNIKQRHAQGMHGL